MSSIDTTIQPLPEETVIEPVPESLTVAPTGVRLERLAWSALVAGSCLLAALVATWPLATTLLTAVPLGTERESTVPLLNIWTLWWNADRLAEGFAHYWDAPFFFPFEGVFTYSEPQTLIGLAVAPLWAVSAPPALIYNLAVLGMLTLNGIFAYRLARALYVPRLPALLAGLLTVTLPFLANMSGVSHLLPIFGLLWTLDGLVRFGESGATRHAVWAALGFMAAYLTSQQYALMFAPFALAAGVLALSQQRFKAQSALRLGLAGLGAALVVLSIALPVFSLHRELGFVRSDFVVERLSARAGDFLTRPANAWLDFPGRNGEDTAGLFPGLLLLGLALAGGFVGRTNPKQRAWTAYLLLGALTATLLAMGLNLEILGWRPFETLRSVIPGLAELRSPFRYTTIMQLMLPILAGMALARMSLRLARTGTLAIALLAIIAAAENLSVPAALAQIPVSPRAGWTDWLLAQPPQTVVAHVPFPGGTRVSDYEVEGRRLLAQMEHGKFITNGYSGYFPPGYTEFQLDMAKRFPERDLLCELQRGLEVDTLVVDQSWLATHSAQMRKIEEYLTPAYNDAQVQIYRILLPDSACAQGNEP
ncbi:MAG: hypothetical protein ABIO92_08595 [Chloroflexia bacterium]